MSKKNKIKKPKKANNRIVNKDFLNHRVAYSKKLGYAKQKWVMFCETMLDQGFTCSLYEAKQTVSKYITVAHEGKSFRVRFSNHKPIAHREQAGDCDFFVGHTNLKITTTVDAIKATMEFFGRGDAGSKTSLPLAGVHNGSSPEAMGM